MNKSVIRVLKEHVKCKPQNRE